MTDVLIRDVPEDVLAAIDAQAQNLGISRTEYLRRILDRERTHLTGPVTVEHLQRFAELAADLLDPEFRAWVWR